MKLDLWINDGYVGGPCRLNVRKYTPYAAKKAGLSHDQLRRLGDQTGYTVAQLMRCTIEVLRVERD